MGAPTNYFVDPSLGSDTGDGSVGTPWGRAAGEVLQWALDTGISSPDLTNGEQINVKAGTDDVFSGTLDLSTRGAASDAAPVIVRGYTSTANDGGQGGIDGNGGNFSVITGFGTAWVQFVDMHIHNTGTAIVVDGDFGTYLLNCEIDNSSTGLVTLTEASVVQGCHLHNSSGYGIRLNGQGTAALDNYLTNAASDFADAIEGGWQNGSDIRRNIISVDGASNGIRILGSNSTRVAHNSILSSSGTGKGIYTSSPAEQGIVINNLVEGFSGGGGIGINLTTAEWIVLFTGNGTYNNTTNQSNTGDVRDEGNNDVSLASSPFAKSGADTFANRFVYFEPNDVGNVHGGAYPVGSRIDKGAVQSAAAAGGGGTANFFHGKVG